MNVVCRGNYGNIFTIVVVIALLIVRSFLLAEVDVAVIVYLAPSCYHFPTEPDINRTGVCLSCTKVVHAFVVERAWLRGPRHGAGASESLYRTLTSSVGMLC